MTSELITFNHLRCHSSQQHLELELITESQLGEVQMKPPLVSYLYAADTPVCYSAKKRIGKYSKQNK